jgi:beta-phosphoglucomutase
VITKNSARLSNVPPQPRSLCAPGLALALDLDGVLIDGMPFHMEAWRHAFNHFGATLPEARLYELEGLPTWPMAKVLTIESGTDFTDRELRELVRMKREFYAQIFRVVPLPGSHHLLALARRYEYRVAIVTGSTATAATMVINKLGAEDIVRHVVSGEDTPVGKPSAQPYRLALDKLGVAPSNCLAIENAPAGIQSAMSAGMPCLAVATYLPASALAHASLVLPSVQSAAEWIQNKARIAGDIGSWRFRDLRSTAATE